MKRLVVAIVCAGLAWSAWWFVASHRLTSATEAWFAEQTARGGEARYGDFTVKGFPNRLDQRFSDLLLSAPDQSVRWSAPFLQVFRLVYNPNHLIMAFPPEQQVVIDGALVGITSEAMRASMVLDDDGRVQRANLEADSLSLNSNALKVALAEPRIAIEAQSETTYRVALFASSVASNAGLLSTDGGALGHGLSLDLTAEFSQPWTAQTRPTITALTVRRADFVSDGMALKAKGDLAFGPLGRASGQFTLRAENWAEALNALEASGELPPGMAGLIRDALSLIAQLSGRPDALDIPLTVRSGTVSIGKPPLNVPIGQIPPVPGR